MVYRDKYLAMTGQWPKKIPHRELWSNPDAETYFTGIDYYDHPRLCRQKMAVLYPQLELPIPETDEPIKRPDGYRARWGDGETYGDGGKVGGNAFNSEEEVFSFSPVADLDYTKRPVTMNWDFSSDESIHRHIVEQFSKDMGKEPPKKTEEGSTDFLWFYNTMFMWPLLTFGWELFLQCCLDERFGRIMDEFAMINRRVFKAFAEFPVNFIVCHDDLATTRGPVCSPKWMNKYIFPYYEEFFSMMKAGGKKIIFTCDGCVDALADDVLACGAAGIITEPYADFKKIASKHKDIMLTGEGDNQVLMRGNKDEIRMMVESMVETAGMNGGYLMSIGNHIPWNVPAEAIKYYLETAGELAYRK